MDTHMLEVLMNKIAHGDLEALEGLYREFHHAVFAYSLHLLHDRAHAEDNAQDVFLQIWAKSATYKPGSGPTAWMMRITHNLAIDRLRRISREISYEELPEDEWTDEGGIEHQTVGRIDLQTMLGILESKDRQIVLLKAVAGLPLKTVSQLTGLPLSTVHWRYQRALRLLSVFIKKMEV
jgi:RNA polymerase sigma-70 factor (ECF subfamily)